MIIEQTFVVCDICGAKAEIEDANGDYPPGWVSVNDAVLYTEEGEVEASGDVCPAWHGTDLYTVSEILKALHEMRRVKHTEEVSAIMETLPVIEPVFDGERMTESEKLDDNSPF